MTTTRPLPERPGLRKAALITYGSYLGVSILGLVNVLLVARALGPTGRGQVTFLMTVAGITGFVFNLSVQEANANLSGQRPTRLASLGSNSVAISVGLGLVGSLAAVLALAYVPFLEQDVTTIHLVIALVSIPAVMLQTYMIYLARGSYRFTVANVALPLSPLIAVTVNGVMLASGTLSVTTALAAWSAGNLASAALLASSHWRAIGYGKPDRELAGEMVSFGAKSHVGGILATGSYRMDSWILGAVAGPRELGLYAVAVAWFEGLFILPVAVSQVARPDLVRANGVEAGRKIAALFRATITMTAILAAGLFVAAPILCGVIFGPEFENAVSSLRLLAAGALGVTAAKLLGFALIAQGRPLLESAAMGVGFVAAISLYVTLIPAYGADGAAIASTVAYTLAGLTAAVLVVRALDVKPRDLIPRPADLRTLTDYAVTLRGRRRA